MLISQYARTDTEKELDLVNKLSLEAGANCSISSDHWSKGGQGAVALAEAIIKQSPPEEFRFLYDLDVSFTLYSY